MTMLAQPTITRIQELQGLFNTAMALSIEELETDPTDAPYRIHCILASLPDAWKEIDHAVYQGRPPQSLFTSAFRA